MNKIKAASTHVLISVFFISLLFLIVYFLWYPKPFFNISNVIEPFKLLIMIDIVIGPLLTFIVYKKGKSTLVMDLSIIGIIQVAAFIYGAYIIANGRPVLIAMNNGQFHYLIDKFIDPEKLSEDYQPSLINSPKYAYIEKLESIDIYNSVASAKEFDPSINEIIASSLTADNLIAKFTEQESQIKGFAEKYKEEDITFYQLNNEGMIYYVIYSKKQKKIIEKINF